MLVNYTCFLFFNLEAVDLHLTRSKPGSTDYVAVIGDAVIGIPMVGGNVVLNTAEAGSPQTLDRGIEQQMEHSAFLLIVV